MRAEDDARSRHAQRVHEHAPAGCERRVDKVDTCGEGKEELSLFVDRRYIGAMQGEPFNVQGSRFRCYAQDVSNGVFPKDQFYVFPTRWEVTENHDQECTSLVSASLGRGLYEEMAGIPAEIYTILNSRDDVHQS